LIKWLVPLVNNLHALCTRAAIFTSASFVFPPAKAVFPGVGVLLSTAKYVRASYDALVDVFECIKKAPPPIPAPMVMMLRAEGSSAAAVEWRDLLEGEFCGSLCGRLEILLYGWNEGTHHIHWRHVLTF